MNILQLKDTQSVQTSSRDIVMVQSTGCSLSHEWPKWFYIIPLLNKGGGGGGVENVFKTQL